MQAESVSDSRVDILNLSEFSRDLLRLWTAAAEAMVSNVTTRTLAVVYPMGSFKSERAEATIWRMRHPLNQSPVVAGRFLHTSGCFYYRDGRCGMSGLFRLGLGWPIICSSIDSYHIPSSVGLSGGPG